MLECCGESGYARVSVQRVLERSGCSRSRFYRLFANKSECFRLAYEEEANALAERLLGHCREGGSWRDGVVAAFAELGEYLCEQPLRARALILEVHVAGGAAFQFRDSLFSRFAKALDGARSERSTSRYPPPPLAATFMVSTIDTAVAAVLSNDEPASFATTALPSLLFVLDSAYFGEDAADRYLSGDGGGAGRSPGRSPSPPPRRRQ